MQGSGSGGGGGAGRPSAGWDPEPGKPMVTLTVREEQGVPLTAEMIRRMTWHQHAKIWKVRSGEGGPS